VIKIGDIIDLHERLRLVELATRELQEKAFPERFKEEKKEENKD